MCDGRSPTPYIEHDEPASLYIVPGVGGGGGRKIVAFSDYFVKSIAD